MVTPLLSPASRAASTENLLTPSSRDAHDFRVSFPTTSSPPSCSPSSSSSSPCSSSSASPSPTTCSISSSSSPSSSSSSVATIMPRPLITMGESADSGDSTVMSSGYPSAATVSLNQRCTPAGVQETNGATRSVPDIELHARENNGRPEYRGYRLLAPQVRCSCSHLPRAPSHESIRSVQGGISEVVVVAPTSYRDRIIRQHSQPETCLHCHHAKPSGSLRHLSRLDSCSASSHAAEGIATIAADTLRINGALSSFKQVSGRCSNI